MRKVFYTCVTGNYDFIFPPVKTPGWDYLLFTDNPNLEVKGWEIINIESKLEPQKTARCVKIMPFSFFEADISIWADSAIRMNINLDGFVAHAKNNSDFAIMRHPYRDCIYDELKECKRLCKDEPNIMQKQVNLYRKNGYPAHNGLVSSGVIIREHTDRVKEFCSKWWDEVSKYSVRDQLSFNYVAWRDKFKYETFPYLLKGGFPGITWDPLHRVKKKSRYNHSTSRPTRIP